MTCQVYTRGAINCGNLFPTVVVTLFRPPWAVVEENLAVLLCFSRRRGGG